MAIAYNTVTAAASVGENTPLKMPPMMTTGVSSAGKETMKELRICRQVARGCTGRLMRPATIYSMIIMASVHSKPGTIPPRNRPPIDAPDTTPYTTIGMLGGTSGPRMDDTAVSAAARSWG